MVCRGGGLPKSWMPTALPWFRLQVLLRHKKPLDVLLDDDALRGVRSAMEHHHGDQDNRRRFPRKLRAELGFLTNTQLRCVRWRVQCNEALSYNAVVQWCVTFM